MLSGTQKKMLIFKAVKILKSTPRVSEIVSFPYRKMQFTNSLTD
jgi:hypothetical protein